MAPTKRRNPRPDAFRTIAEFTYDWETWIDADGRARWVNPAVERITGYSVAECLAHAEYPLCFAHPSDRVRLSRVLASAAKGEAGNDVEFRVRRKDGRIRWVAVSWQAMRDRRGRSMGYRTSIRDIDERKRMERQMRQLQRTAERAALARSQLLANVSHELRSPVHCIAGFAELLAAADLPPREHHHVRVIADQSMMMQRQVEDLLQIASLDVATPRIDQAPFELRVLLSSLVDAAELRARAAGNAVRVERAFALESRWVIGDRVRIAQVLRNLLDNALKFTERGSIRVCAVRQRDGMKLIEVRDTGIGMTPSQLRSAREPFFQADSGTDRAHGGVGLGLAIVERLVAAMGGRFELTSTRRSGTAARVFLPLPPTQPSVTAALSGQLPILVGTALVVDDSPVARELMVEWLHALGWQAVTAATGKEAIALARQRHFDVILLDFQMPGLDGGQTALKLHRYLQPSRTNPSGTRVVLITADAVVGEQLGRARSAIDQILVKPVTRENVISVLHGAVSMPSNARSRRGANDTELNRETLEELRSTPSSKAANLLAHLAPRTLDEQREALGSLTQAIEAKDLHAARLAAHKVAGLAAVVGAERVAELARELMQVSPEGARVMASVRRLSAAILERWQRAQAELELTLRFQTEHSVETIDADRDPRSLRTPRKTGTPSIRRN